MFTKSITNSSEFLMMPPTAQLLYIHFGMNADDDGFCEIFPIMRMTDSKPDDLSVLQVRKFVKIFDDKILIITNWKENNYIQKDRYTPSKYLQIYKNELKLISEKNKGENNECIHPVYKMDTQDRIGKVRLENNIPVSSSDDPDFILQNKPINGKYPQEWYQEIINFYLALVEKREGYKPEYGLKQTISQLKNLFKRKYTVEQIKSLVEFYVLSEKFSKIGAALTNALTPHSINSWKQKGSPKKSYNL